MLADFGLKDLHLRLVLVMVEHVVDELEGGVEGQLQIIGEGLEVSVYSLFELFAVLLAVMS